MGTDPEGFDPERWDKIVKEDGSACYVLKEPEWYKELSKARRAVENCQGSFILSQFDALDLTYYAFNTNYHQLKTVLEAYNDHRFILESRLWAADNREELARFLKEVIRLLHNFVASAQTLVEHTRIIVRRLYSRTEFLIEYQDRIDSEFKTNGLVQFVQELRNYILHQQMPGITATLSLNLQDHGIRLHAHQMKSSWPGNRISKDFLLQLDEIVPLLTLVEDYRVTVLRFYQWLETRQTELHKTEFEERKKLINVARVLEKKHRPSGDADSKPQENT